MKHLEDTEMLELLGGSTGSNSDSFYIGKMVHSSTVIEQNNTHDNVNDK